MSRWPSRRAWTAIAAVFGLAATGVSAVDRPFVIDLAPASYRESLEYAAAAPPDEVDPRPPWARFAASAPEIEVDARSPRARIPSLLPGPVESWAGSTRHTLRVRLRQLPPEPLILWLHARATHNYAPPHLSVAVNGTPIGRVETRPGGVDVPHHEHRAIRSRYRIRIPAAALGDGSDVRLEITSAAGAWIVLERVRLARATPTFAWAHLAHRERLPPAAAVLLAASLATLLAWSLVGTDGEPWPGRTRRAAAPAAALLLLGAAAARGVTPSLAVLPRWLWLALPWALLAVRPRSLPRQVRDLRRPHALLLNAAVSVVALALSLVVAEVVLRVVFRGVKSAGDVRTYFHQPAYEMNSLGFREREFSLRKPPGVYRIAAIGDSLTFGPGVAAADRFSNRLEHYLRQNGRPGLTYEVLNFGSAGWDTVDEVKILRTLVFGTDPDFVVLQWYVNDVENGDRTGRPGAPLPLVPPEALRLRLLRSSALYSLLEPKWTALQEALLLADTHPAYMYRRFGDPDSPDSKFAIARIREFLAECHAAKTPVAIILFPHPGPDLVEGRYLYNYLHNRVLGACRDEQVACIDLRSTFAKQADHRTLWVTPLDPHPSPLAHRLAAERLIEAFGALWLEGRPNQPAARRRISRGGPIIFAQSSAIAPLHRHALLMSRGSRPPVRGSPRPREP